MTTPQKNTVRPSVRTSDVGSEQPKQLEPIQKDIIWYLKNVCGGQDKYEFDSHEEAYKFGWSLREKYGDKIRVEISVTTVRVFSV
jgi:hypothetical protein